MKEEFINSFDDDSLHGDSYPGHEDEVGMAVNERTPGQDDDDRGDNSDNSDNDQDFFPSDDDDAYEIEEAEEESKIADDIQDEENEEITEGLEGEEKEGTIMDKIKSNLVYIIIALVLVIPASMKLYSIVFGSSNPAPVKTQQPIGFTSEKPVAPATRPAPTAVPEQAAPSSLESLLAPKPVVPEQAPPVQSTTPMAEITPPEIIAPEPGMVAPEMMAPEAAPEMTPQTQMPQETPNSMMPIGGGSEGTSGMMPNQQAQTGDEVLDRFFSQETKVEQEVTQLISRVDEIDARLTEMDSINQRLSALEEGTTGENSNTDEMNEQLQLLANKVNQLDHGLNQLRQKVLMPEVVPTETMGERHMRQAPAGLIVEAVIPGRAWVRNEDAVLMVVEVGDEIPGVGKVTRIDAREGLVATTTQVFKQ